MTEFLSYIMRHFNVKPITYENSIQNMICVLIEQKNQTYNAHMPIASIVASPRCYFDIGNRSFLAGHDIALSSACGGSYLYDIYIQYIRTTCINLFNLLLIPLRKQ